MSNDFLSFYGEHHISPVKQNVDVMMVSCRHFFPPERNPAFSQNAATSLYACKQLVETQIYIYCGRLFQKRNPSLFRGVYSSHPM